MKIKPILGRFLHICALVVLLPAGQSAFAQDAESQSNQITAPSQAVRAVIQASAEPMTVVINGSQELLAPGGTIRDLRDPAKGARVVLVSHLANEIGSARVRAAVERDLNGQLLRVWLLPQKVR